jgi:hypothetical protein
MGALRRIQMKTARTQSGLGRGVVALLVAAVAAACSGQPETARPGTASPPAAAAPASPAPEADAPIPASTSPYDALPEGVRLVIGQPFTGDFDAMVARRMIRVAVTFNRTHYFIDRGQERPRPERVVRQRRAHRLGADRP